MATAQAVHRCSRQLYNTYGADSKTDPMILKVPMAWYMRAAMKPEEKSPLIQGQPFAGKQKRSPRYARKKSNVGSSECRLLGMYLTIT